VQRVKTGTFANQDRCRLGAVTRQAGLSFFSQVGGVRRGDSNKDQWLQGNEGMDEEELAVLFSAVQAGVPCWGVSSKERLQG